MADAISYTIEERAGIPVLVMNQGCRPATDAEVQFNEERLALLQVVEWIYGGFIQGEKRTLYVDPTTFLDQIHAKTKDVLDRLQVE